MPHIKQVHFSYLPNEKLNSDMINIILSTIAGFENDMRRYPYI